MRPEPAPITWMIAAHSAFLSMSATDAFCVLRILPRIGSSAWWSALRASFAVPSALSPSTMNSSLRATSSLRQSASFAGSDRDSSAFLRRWTSRCAGRDAGARRAGDLVEHGLRRWPCRRAAAREPGAELLGHDVGRRCDAAGVPRTSLVWPSNCGSARRTVTIAVRPSVMSSFTTLSSLGLGTFCAQLVVDRLRERRSNPVTWCRPWAWR